MAPALSALARLAYIERDDARAEGLCRKALAVRAGSAPARPLDDADDLNLLTLVLLRRGRPDDALPLARQTIALREATLGSAHPSMVWDLRNLALVESRLGHADAAIDAALRAENLSRDFLRRTGRELAERQVMLVAFSQSSGLDVALEQTVAQAPAGSGGAPERTRRVWDTLVRSRARVLDEMTDRRRALQRSGDPATALLAADLARASAALANLLVRGPAADTTERYAALLEQARGEEEQAERALARSGRTFRAEHEAAAIGLAEVQRTLRSGDAMVAFARYQTQVATAPGGGPPEVGRYLAYVLRGGSAPPAAIPIGTTGEIDALVRRWRREAGHAGGAASIAVQVDEEGYRLAGDELRRRIWDPLLPELLDVDRLFVVPDGALHLVSLAALPSTKGRYLIETGPVIHYLSAERDLATPAPAGSAPANGAPVEAGGLLALGSPDFGAASEPLAAGAPDPAAAGASLSDASGGSDGDGAVRQSCAGLASRTFPMLPASEQEARDVAELWNRSGSGGAVVLTGAQADESAFKTRAPGRSVLHLATHGFFLGQSCGPSGSGGELQLSGLALAGANRHASSGGGGEDGVLLAEEIAAMDLSSVSWAVLSACDTGLGDIVAGEGVFGLRRAFQIAGARTVIMSLWPVGDAEGREWMRALYTARLKKGLGAAEAVRAAGLAMLRRERRTRGTSHPFPWGGFVAAGEWQ